MLATALVVGLTLVATVTDVAWRRIDNWTTYPGMTAAVLINLAGWLLVRYTATAEAWQPWLGWIEPDGLPNSLAGLAACGLLMLVCFVFFRIGGGDVKLLEMTGAFLGLEKGVEMLLWTFVLGGAVGLIVLVWRIGPGVLLSRLLRQLLWLVRLGSWGPLSADERLELQAPLFLAPCALGGLVIVHFSLWQFFPWW
jgi:prepilin peptidase CpaA